MYICVFVGDREHELAVVSVVLVMNPQHEQIYDIASSYSFRMFILSNNSNSRIINILTRYFPNFYSIINQFKKLRPNL